MGTKLGGGGGGGGMGTRFTFEASSPSSLMTASD